MRIRLHEQDEFRNPENKCWTIKNKKRANVAPHEALIYVCGTLTYMV
jgi:hypothetical protein